MIKLVPGADAKIKQLIYENSVRAYYFSVCENYARGFVNPFITNMQILISNLGRMVSEVSNGPNIAYCYTSINYLCETVLDNPGLINTFVDIGLNNKANKNKHTIAKNVTIDMLRCVTAYNNLVLRIADKYGLRSLEHMIVRKADTANVHNRQNNIASKPVTARASAVSNKPVSAGKPRSGRDIPIVDEARHHKYFIVDGVKFQLKLNERYEVDPYAKTISSKITIYWPNGNSGKFVSITVKTANGNKTLCSKNHIDISNANSKEALRFKCNENDLDRRVLYLIVTVKVEKQEQEYAGTTGVLFWKEAHYKTVYKTTGTHTEQVSQFFSKNHET